MNKQMGRRDFSRILVKNKCIFEIEKIHKFITEK